MIADELASYREAWRTRWERKERTLEKLRERALAEARRLAGMLKSNYGCRAVYLIGSLAREEFEEGSDIDLVVEGLDPARYFRALGEIMAMSEFQVDLIPCEDANELVRDRVRSEGKVL